MKRLARRNIKDGIAFVGHIVHRLITSVRWDATRPHVLVAIVSREVIRFAPNWKWKRKKLLIKLSVCDLSIDVIEYSLNGRFRAVAKWREENRASRILNGNWLGSKTQQAKLTVNRNAIGVDASKSLWHSPSQLPLNYDIRFEMDKQAIEWKRNVWSFCRSLIPNSTGCVLSYEIRCEVFSFQRDQH